VVNIVSIALRIKILLDIIPLGCIIWNRLIKNREIGRLVTLAVMLTVIFLCRYCMEIADFCCRLYRPHVGLIYSSVIR